MQTKILNGCQIDEAVNLLKNGEVVALPTETVYGLAADAHNDEAVQKIFTAKGRPSDHPLIVHVDSFDKVQEWADNISDNARILAEHFWPGPLTMVFQKRKEISGVINGSLDTVAIRIPNHPIILSVIKKLGRGIVAPSANAHKKTSPTKPEHVLKTLEGKIAGVVDGGLCSVGIESTIIDMTHEKPIILRHGVITPVMIEKVLAMKIEVPAHHDQKVAGNMQIHYQPEKPLYLLSAHEIGNRLQTEDNVAVMHYSSLDKSDNAVYYQMPENKMEYAQNLYMILHQIDNSSVDKIFVEIPPVLSEWSDIHDRLTKASTKK